ncbi:protein kinase [bacterium]|nr:protein kinase [bacterium]
METRTTADPLGMTQAHDAQLPQDVTLQMSAITGSPVSADDCLKQCPAFHRLSDELQTAVRERLQPHEFQAREFLIAEGVAGKGLWLLVEGRVEIQLQRGNDPTYISTVGPGEVLGEMSLLTNEPATASAIAATHTQAYLLPAADFHTLVVQFPDLAMVLTRVIAARLGGANLDVLAGKVLDQYLIRRRLAKGGMSVVYDAERQSDGRRAALKMMSHRLVYDPWALAAFQREADLIADFQHPNIVQLLGRFQAFHTHFIAMEYCDGEDLKSLLERCGKLHLDEVHHILGQLAAALDYSHSHGVVHRDLKPSNIMQTSTGRVMLMDFGLAKPSVEQTLQREEIVGTPRYMAPEQLRGEAAHEVADYFAFGCIAYELVLGIPLISASTLFELRETHHYWSVNNIVEECATRDPEVAEILQHCLQPLTERRTLDLKSLATWAPPLA